MQGVQNGLQVSVPRFVAQGDFAPFQALFELGDGIVQVRGPIVNGLAGEGQKPLVLDNHSWRRRRVLAVGSGLTNDRDTSRSH
jgi:hypothetical protein